MSIITRLFSKFIPHRCVLCGNQQCKNLDLCIQCLEIIPWLKSHCQRCANPLPEHLHQTLCGQCIKQPPIFHETITLFKYEKPASYLLTQFKFQQKLAFGHLLGKLLAEKISARKLMPDLIIPVPLHKKRMQQRGYNQALEIARPLSKALAVPMEKYALKRIRFTPAQSSIPAKERKKNVRNAFDCSQDLSEKIILLVDDVITTGNTIHECCRVLNKAGAKRIDVCSIAKTSL